MRYFIKLSYDGAAYCGWQRQPDMPTVQESLEKALSTFLREKIEVVGAGRTDTGVSMLLRGSIPTTYLNAKILFAVILRGSVMCPQMQRR